MPQTWGGVTTQNFPFRIMLIARQLRMNGKKICNWMALVANGLGPKTVRMMQFFLVNEPLLLWLQDGFER